MIYTDALSQQWEGKMLGGTRLTFTLEQGVWRWKQVGRRADPRAMTDGFEQQRDECHIKGRGRHWSALCARHGIPKGHHSHWALSVTGQILSQRVGHQPY